MDSNMQWLVDSLNPPALVCILQSAHYPVRLLAHNVPEELGQLSQRYSLHQVAVAFGDGRAPPPEVTHPIDPVLSFLWAQLDVRLGADFPSQLSLILLTSRVHAPLCFFLITAPLPASLEGEAAL